MFEYFLIRSGLKKDTSWSHFVFQWLTLAFILHLLAAIRGTGFFHSQEHFQVIEFINYKLGRGSVGDLPIEFKQMLQSWIFPSVLTGITHFLNAIGITNPFDWALSFRVFSSLLGWLGLAGLALCCYLWIEDRIWRQRTVIALTLCWYLPFFHARHAAENVAGSLFMIGLSLLLLATPARSNFSDRPKSIPSILAGGIGLLFGIAFQVHPPLGIMILGVQLWLLIFAQLPVKNYAPLYLGILTAFGLGTVSDYWGYGQWTFTPWNSFKYFILENNLSLSGTSPWTEYVYPSLSTSTWDSLWKLGACGALTVCGIFWLRNPKHILTWCLAPFLIVLCATPHKELRYLLPLFHAFGVLFILCFLPLAIPKKGFFVRSTRLKFPQILTQINTQIKRRWVTWPLNGLLVLNLCALLITSLLPAHPPALFYSQLYAFHPYRFELYYKEDKFLQWEGAPLHFYRPENLPAHRINQYQHLYSTLDSRESPIWLFFPDSEIPSDLGNLHKWCKLEFSTLSPWQSRWSRLLNQKGTETGLSKWLGSFNWTLFRCQNPSHRKLRLHQT